jgi:hypothetical protein
LFVIIYFPLPFASESHDFPPYFSSESGDILLHQTFPLHFLEHVNLCVFAGREKSILGAESQPRNI